MACRGSLLIVGDGVADDGLGMALNETRGEEVDGEMGWEGEGGDCDCNCDCDDGGEFGGGEFSLLIGCLLFMFVYSFSSSKLTFSIEVNLSSSPFSFPNVCNPPGISSLEILSSLSLVCGKLSRLLSCGIFIVGSGISGFSISVIYFSDLLGFIPTSSSSSSLSRNILSCDTRIECLSLDPNIILSTSFLAVVNGTLLPPSNSNSFISGSFLEKAEEDPSNEGLSRGGGISCDFLMAKAEEEDENTLGDVDGADTFGEVGGVACGEAERVGVGIMAPLNLG